MNLRRRMMLSSSMQLLAVGAMLAFAYVGFRQAVMPTLRAHIRVKSSDAAAALRAELEVPLAADDRPAIAAALDRLDGDPDLAYVEILDAESHVVERRGAPNAKPAGGPPITPAAADGGFVSWSDVRIEGVLVGRVEVRYSTAGIDRVNTWAAGFAAVAVLVWLAAFAYSIRFSRDFVAPIRRMMEFSGQVAGGRFTEQLDDAAPGELGELKQHLNRMSRDLASREQERQRSAARAEEMRQELLTVSRMAGMAEVATGVLHNVGNVLNSLNTSVSVMTDQLRNSKLKSLAKTIALYRSHPGGLAGFLGTAKGELLPRYLEKVAGQLTADNADVQRELESITRNVHHIATIVSTQQAYTRVAAIREDTSLPEVIDDALGMVEGSFARHRIEVVKDYAALPPVVTDRHKVLQIVVNLISNARHALKDRAAPRLLVAIARIDGGVTITVDDNGVGIAPDLLVKIFQHGFTTKKDGHGFGLHSAANAAAELGGQLTAESAGLDRGARFTLTLPDQPDKVPDVLAS